MRREAILKEVAFFNDAWHDHYIYAILRDEWEKSALRLYL